MDKGNINGKVVLSRWNPKRKGKSQSGISIDNTFELLQNDANEVGDTQSNNGNEKQEKKT
ncbi:hypothetical protein H5410_060842 [Solanum commersonii]|uniref:Uncharacterized protein n=1 Tax=Solanum commersonii TaxID=4109 RepID=A0A9J5W779_SOLCO|nr:hypothetical protein H5410_060842 [Solanum commersonii]